MGDQPLYQVEVVLLQENNATQEDAIVNATLATLSHEQMRQLKLDPTTLHESGSRPSPGKYSGLGLYEMS